MHTKFVEVKGKSGGMGRFVVGSFHHVEWCRHSAIMREHDIEVSLLRSLRYERTTLLVCDLSTGCGGLFNVVSNRNAAIDFLNKQFPASPLFVAFLIWLYEHAHEYKSVRELPDLIELELVELIELEPVVGHPAGDVY